MQIGDVIGEEERHTRPDPSSAQSFAPPTLESVVCLSARGQGTVRLALTHLAEQDPLIDLREDGVRQEAHLSLYGEVQKEVIAATLADDFGVEVASATA